MNLTYQRIYNDLKQAIDAGRYRYKDFLPSEAVLARRYECAHNTVRKAIAALSREGFVQPIHGKGVRVIYQSSQALVQRLAFNCEPDGLEAFRDMGIRTGFELTTQVLSFERIPVDGELAALSGFEAGAEALKIQLVRRYDGRPLEREINYFRYDLVEGITKEDIEHSVYHYIEEVRGARLVTAKRVLTIEPAEPEDIELLDLQGASSVAEIVNVTFDGDGMVSELTYCRHVPRLFSFSQTTVRNAINL